MVPSPTWPSRNDDSDDDDGDDDGGKEDRGERGGNNDVGTTLVFRLRGSELERIGESRLGHPTPVTYTQIQRDRV